MLHPALAIRQISLTGPGFRLLGGQWGWHRYLPRLLLISILLQPISAEASGDGPRVHRPSPTGMNALIFHVSSLEDANRTFDPSLITPNLRFDTTIATVQYARTTEIAGRHVLFTGMLRGGNSSRASEQPGQSASSSGLADPVVATSINLAGLPPMSRPEFRAFRPGTTVNLFLAAILPLGEYDSENLVNLGSNRYAFRIGLPVVYPLDRAGRRTTLELVPNVHIFTENEDTGLKQDPLLTVEGHLTHDLTGQLWGAFGALWTAGGATKIGGVRQNGAQRSLALSATLGYEISPGWALHLRVGETVAQNEFGLDGTLYHLKFVSRY